MKGANFEKKLPCLKWRHELLSVFSWRAIISPQAEFAVCIWCAMNFSLPAWQAWQLFIFLSFNFPCHGNMELAKLISNKNISTIMDTKKCDSLWRHARGEREWLLSVREWEGNWKSPFPKFGNGKGIKKSIPKFREWEGNEKIPFPKFGNGKGMKKIHSQNSGTGREWKNPFPKFGKGNQRPPFLGMTGNGNSRSPLVWKLLLGVASSLMRVKCTTYRFCNFREDLIWLWNFFEIIPSPLTLELLTTQRNS